MGFEKAAKLNDTIETLRDKEFCSADLNVFKISIAIVHFVTTMAEQFQGTEAAAAEWLALNSTDGIAETGGEENSTATDFSRFWAIALLVEELEAANQDYVLVFEFLQDIAVLSGGEIPTKAILYQVKKKERSSWTRANLLHQKSTKPQSDSEVKVKKLQGSSPLGKLYICVEAASKLAESLGVFLSDAPFDLRTKGEELLPLHSKVRIDQLGLGDEFRIRQSLAKELNNATLEFVDSIYLQQCRITPGGMREYAEGVISRHIDKKFPGRLNVSGTVLEKLLYEFSQRSGNTPACSSLQDLIKHKGFTREQFNQLLSDLTPTRSWDDRLATLIDDLKASGMEARRAERLRRLAQTLEIRLVGTPKIAQTHGWETAVRIANTSPLSYEQLLSEIAESIREEQFRAGGKSLSQDERFATGIVAILYVENESSLANSESEVETK